MTLTEKQPTKTAKPENPHKFNLKDWKKVGVTLLGLLTSSGPVAKALGDKIDQVAAKADAAAAKADAAAAAAEEARLTTARIEGKVDALTSILSEREKRRTVSGVPTNAVSP